MAGFRVVIEEDSTVFTLKFFDFTVFAIDKSQSKQVYTQILIEPYPVILELLGATFSKDDEVATVIFSCRQSEDASQLHFHFQQNSRDPI